VEAIHGQTSVAGLGKAVQNAYLEKETPDIAADPVVRFMGKEQLQKALTRTRKEMEKAAKALDFIEAARLRDELFALEKLLNEKFH